MAHAIAPGATIILVEASSANNADLLTAVATAASQANVVSMSWGGNESSGESADDSEYFATPKVAFVASAGDSGAPAEWPSASPNVLSVGGTALTLTASNAWSSETGWNDGGGGPSKYEAQPSYQTGVVTQTSTKRATPDVAYDASPSTGVSVYDSVPYEGTTYDWLEVGGTSAGAPQWSALLAIADQGRALGGESPLNATNPQQVMDILYQNASDFHDITSGTSVGSPHYSAGPGYDYVTGVGTPIANLVVGSLVGTPTAPVDHLVLSAPATATAGTSFTLTITAETASGATDTGYVGTIAFTSTAAKAGLPSNFTFPAADDGTATFTVTLDGAGSQTITATDTSTGAITGTTSAIAVSPAAASQFVLSGLSSTATVGAAETVTVTAEDPYGNVATGYTGTVHFTSNDTAAILPSNYTFNTTTDQGVHTFSITFGTAGTQSVSVTDTTSGFSATQSGIAVAPAAPTNLAATAISSTQINLTWTGSSGATGYLIQESLSSSTGWSQIGTTAGGTTIFDVTTGLTAGTTYFFRVIATVGSTDSAASNVANATTTGTAPSADSIWSNSYVPSEDYYSYGSYEVGVKFTSSVAGEVTGIRFYKQTWMGGYLHVGHLWSSTGTLLATATFTNETSYGWQQINLSTPVAIKANTVYIVSFSTGGGYFGLTSTTFLSGGVTNGPLEALPNSVSGGDGVYNNRSGRFPNVDGDGMNFWADVAFAPSSSGNAIAKSSATASPSIAAGGFGIAALTTAQPDRSITTTPAATPAGPAPFIAASRGATTTALGSLSYRRTIAQSVTLASPLKKSFFAAEPA